ncbi:MAG: aldo/keto reductase [Lachnoclostridium sp.]|jgi:predicted aldo/keto reductase-like oxidoreductase|nr:aldo/keto reductase [Lachnoclostridium sp.]
MEMRKMEKLGVETSLLGFGCMRFPTSKNGKIDRVLTEHMINKAIDHGVNYFDTAWFYHDGESEVVVGEILKKKKRDTFYIATKLPIGILHNKKEAQETFAKQLRRLQMDWFDFYLLHGISREGYEKAVKTGMLDLCLDLQKQGRIKNLGFSFHGPYEDFEYILNDRDWDFCQIQLNYMDTDDQAGLKGYELTREKGVPAIIMEPVKGGSLAKLPDEILDILKGIDFKGSCASLAMRFVGELENVKVVLSGMSSIEQVEDNLSTFNKLVPLTEIEHTALDNVKASMDKRVCNNCTDCKYCMPCPAGVNIPKNFYTWNQYGVYQNLGWLNWQWKYAFPESEKGIHCTDCGACEKACPQKITIREDLKKARKDIEEALKNCI